MNQLSFLCMKFFFSLGSRNLSLCFQRIGYVIIICGCYKFYQLSFVANNGTTQFNPATIPPRSSLINNSLRNRGGSGLCALSTTSPTSLSVQPNCPTFYQLNRSTLRGQSPANQSRGLIPTAMKQFFSLPDVKTLRMTSY